MCGRTVCALAPSAICQSCSTSGTNGVIKKPKWRVNSKNSTYQGKQANLSGLKEDTDVDKSFYKVSYNVSPTAETPVLISKDHLPCDCSYELCYPQEQVPNEYSLNNNAATTEEHPLRVVQTMRWGLVPSWHKGNDLKTVTLKLNNARSDKLQSSQTFTVPLNKGRRCVILCDGYYEWQTVKGVKQPFYIYFPQTLIPEEKLSKSPPTKKLLTMAGLFDVWKSKDTGSLLYSYSIITVDSHPELSFIHHRMPAILHGDEEIDSWLDFKNVQLKEALKLIRPSTPKQLSFHQVSNLVNNSRNNSVDCIKLNNKSASNAKGNKLMTAWLEKGKNKRENQEDPLSPIKQIKVENI